MALPSGFRLGPYEIVALLGAGGMGEVYRARDSRLERAVAIKVLSEESATAPQFRSRFESEARAVAALSHANILAIFDVGTGEPPYLVTELLEGETLRALVTRGPLPYARVIELALQLVSGLAAAHARGIVHRDLKPDNVMVTNDGVLKILDFGLAKTTALGELAFDKDVTRAAGSMPGLVLGTLGYMSPEQVRGQSADARSDIFSLGTMLYEMTTGQRAFAGETPADTMSAVLREPPPDLELRSSTSLPLARLIRRCLEKDPGERFQSARDLKFALEAVADTPPALVANQPAKAAPTKSVAVLPFVNMSADAENQYFSDGLTEDLINALTRLPGLHVASRTSAFRFRDSHADLAQIGQELHVATVLEGSVRRSGTRLRITTQLTNVADGFHVWSDRYDREMADVFEIQDEIVGAIVQALAPALAGEARKAVGRPTENMEAYELYLKGRHLWYLRTPSMMQAAMRCFEQVIALDPEYALAYAGLADCYSVYRIYGWFPAESREKTRHAVTSAMALDPSLAEVHYSQGAFVFVFEPRWQEAEVHFRRAIAINPRMAIAHAYLGMMASCERRHDNAIAHADRACELDPLAGVIMYIASSIYTDAGRFEQAERLARRALELQPESPAGIRSLNIALMGQERHEEAVAVAERVVAFSRMPMYVGLLGLSYARAGRIEPARLLLAELAERKDRGEYVGPNGALAINVGLGDVGGIRTGLQECIADRTPILALRLVSGVFLDPYRADAEVDRLYGALYRGN